MKKLLFTLSLVFTTFFASSQIFFSEDFESGSNGNGLPIAGGWQEQGLSSDGIYMIGDDVSANSAGFWPVPSHTMFLQSNDDACDCDKSQDRIILPNQDFSTFVGGVRMVVDLYWDDAFGGQVTLEVSTNGGATWNVEANIPSVANQWQDFQVFDLSAYVGQSNVLISFLYNDQGQWGNGFALDNVILAQSLADFTVDVTTNCSGQDFNFSDASQGLVFSWDWDFGPDASIQNFIGQFPPAITFSTPGLKTISLTINGGESTETKVDFIDVIETPIIAQIPDINACPGDVVPDIQISQLTTYTVDWTNDNTNTGIPNTSGTGDIPSFSAVNPNPGGGAEVSVITMTAANGVCVSNPVTFNFIVNPIPVVNGGNDVIICSGQSITMTGSGTANSYTWDNNITDGVAFTPAAGNYIYTVTGDINGCTNVDQVNVTVKTTPTVQAGTDVIVCSGSQVTLTGSGATTLTWDNGVSNGVPFTPAVSGDYIVTGTSNNGCSDMDTLVLTIENLPNPNFVADQNLGCILSDITFNSTVVPNMNTCVYTISDGSTVLGCQNAVHTFTSVGFYDVTLIETSPNGCVGSTTVTNMVIINPDPVASFTADETTVDMLNPNVSFDNNSTGAFSYQWDFGHNLSGSTEENPYHEFPGDVSGTYTVTLVATTDFGCTDTMQLNIKVDESTIFYIANSFTPNGDESNNTFNPLLYSGFDPQDYLLRIFNRFGEMIFESKDPSIGWDGDYGAGRGVAPTGVYTYKLVFNTVDKDEKKVLVGSVNLLR